MEVTDCSVVAVHFENKTGKTIRDQVLNQKRRAAERKGRWSREEDEVCDPLYFNSIISMADVITSYYAVLLVSICPILSFLGHRLLSSFVVVMTGNANNDGGYS